MLAINTNPWERACSRYGLLLAAGLVALLCSPSLPALWHVWWDSGTFNHCLIVIPAAAWLVWEREPGTSEPAARLHYVPAGLLFNLALVWWVARITGIQVVEQAALVAMVPTLAWAWNGNAWAKRHRFALLFCLLATPVGEFLVPPLMELTASITVFLVKLCGIPVLRDGMRLSLASGDFVVAEACSGIRYLIASFTLGLLFAQVTFRSTKRKVWFVVASILIPIVANGLRAWLMVMIAHFSNLEYATGFDHLVYGWVLFGVVMLVLFAVGSRFAELIPNREQARSHEASCGSELARDSSARKARVMALLLIAWAPLADWGAGRYFATLDGNLPAAEFPRELAGYVYAGPGAFPSPLIYPGADRIDTAVYRRLLSAGDAGDELHYAVVRFERDRPGHKFVSTVNKPWDFDWHRLSSGEEPFAGGVRRYDDVERKVRDIGDDAGRPWRLYSWYEADGEVTLSDGRAKWLGLRDWLKPRAAQPAPAIHVVAVGR